MLFRSILLVTILVAFCLTVPMGLGDLKSEPIRVYAYSSIRNLVGISRRHVIKKGETLLDIARMYDLGFNEIRDLYPDWDPWLPPAGVTVDIPSQWILPETLTGGILVNTAELRLYYFSEENGTVSTFPIGIGDPAWPTPEGTFEITARIFKPTWTVPPSLQNKYGARTIPPGPDNPLGEYWLGLGNSSYGIHGTDFPWAVGRTVTRGCIRMYPEDIRMLFTIVPAGTLVKIVYKPVKISNQPGKVFLEVHRDIYGKIGNIARYAHLLLLEQGVADHVDPEKFRQALELRSGMPVDITGMPGYP
jgi:L,D-transpeptidase ErfK/SrfK